MEGAESHGKRESGTTWAFNPRLRPSSAYGRISGLGSQRRRHQVIRECSGNAIALGAQLRMLRGSILKFDRVITAWHRSHETSQRLDRSPGLDPALTNALIASSLIRVRAGLMVILTDAVDPAGSDVPNKVRSWPPGRLQYRACRIHRRSPTVDGELGVANGATDRGQRYPHRWRGRRHLDNRAAREIDRLGLSS